MNKKAALYSLHRCSQLCKEYNASDINPCHLWAPRKHRGKWAVALYDGGVYIGLESPL